MTQRLRRSIYLKFLLWRVSFQHQKINRLLLILARIKANHFVISMSIKWRVEDKLESYHTTLRKSRYYSSHILNLSSKIFENRVTMCFTKCKKKLVLANYPISKLILWSGLREVILVSQRISMRRSRNQFQKQLALLDWDQMVNLPNGWKDTNIF